MERERFLQKAVGVCHGFMRHHILAGMAAREYAGSGRFFLFFSDIGKNTYDSFEIPINNYRLTVRYDPYRCSIFGNKPVFVGAECSIDQL